MIKYRGGQKVQKGDYWNFSIGERVHVDEESVLPGESRVKYIKTHPIMVILAGPVLGIIYAVFLPLLGIAMLVIMAAKKVFEGLLGYVGRVAGVRWNPHVAYLSGKDNSRKKKPEEGDKKKGQGGKE